jgi:hypothetical protein
MKTVFFAGRQAGKHRCSTTGRGEAPHREGHHHTARVFAEDFRRAGDVSTDAQSYGAMNNLGLVLLECVTLAVVVFGALAVFMIRRWFSPTREPMSVDFWLRFTVLRQA